jgi:transposase
MIEIVILKIFAENISLKNEVAAQAEQLALLAARVEQSAEAYKNLQHQLNGLLRNRFGRRSERDQDADNPHDDDDMSPVDPSDDDTIPVDAHERRKKHKKDTSQYPRTIEIIAVPDEDKVCSCGCQKQVIRYETKELFHLRPAEFSILEQRREVVACPNGCAHAMQTAPAPLHILPKAKVTEALLAHIIVSKLHHRQPLYHLEKYALSVDISRETMARWVIQVSEALQPLVNLMKDVIIDHDVASLDATTLQVLNEPDRLATTKSYLYCMRGGTPGRSVVLYDYNAYKHKQFVDDWFADFTGYVHMDTDPFFSLLLEDDAVLPVYCHAHCRRKFEAVKKQAKKQGLAHEALRYYKKLYQVEREAQALSEAQRFVLRLERAKPILEEFQQWLNQHYSTVLPESPLGKAFRYALKYWEGLNHYLNDGRLEIDNNATEQQIKPFVVIRKNFLFANSVSGARAIAVHFTALCHQLNPYDYFHTILKEIPHCHTVEDHEKLLPWNVQLAQE